MAVGDQLNPARLMAAGRRPETQMPETQMPETL
jgi:hypothetical protein